MQKKTENGFSSDSAGQSSFEYVMILAGAILIVTIVILVTRSQIVSSISKQTNQSVGDFLGILSNFNKTK